MKLMTEDVQRRLAERWPSSKVVDECLAQGLNCNRLVWIKQLVIQGKISDWEEKS